MFTSIDKALVALVMAVLSIITIWTGWGLDFIHEEQVATVLAVLTPFFVWLVPNKYAPQLMTNLNP